MSRIYLSPPHMAARERDLLLEAFDSNWIAPLGPQVDEFERELAAAVGVPHALALASGTAALHLALLVLGVGPGDDVVLSTFTFAAVANAVRYVGATPVFIDSDEASWNLDADLLAEELDERQRSGRPAAAAIVVDLYGQCADFDRIRPLCAHHQVPLVEDAAESLGATHGDQAAGSLGDIGVYSFNGNKIITTSGGGMLVSERLDLVERARHLSSQAKEPAAHYEHLEVGYNYRLSNLLAAVGRGQLARLDDLVARRRQIRRLYAEALGDVPGFSFMPDAPYGRPTNWLTCLTVDADAFGATRDAICATLAALDIEARPTWKPMHQQAAYAGCATRGGRVADRLFAHGLCLPSGSSMTDDDVGRVVDGVLSAPRSTAGPAGAAR